MKFGLTTVSNVRIIHLLKYDRTIRTGLECLITNKKVFYYHQQPILREKRESEWPFSSLKKQVFIEYIVVGFLNGSNPGLFLFIFVFSTWHKSNINW